MSKFYHESMPSEFGTYHHSATDSEYTLYEAGRWLDHNADVLMARGDEPPLPLIGPLPKTDEAALSLACEVAFARMWIAEQTAVAMSPEQELTLCGIYNMARNREWGLGLLRDLERVTESLTSQAKEMI